MNYCKDCKHFRAEFTYVIHESGQNRGVTARNICELLSHDLVTGELDGAELACNARTGECGFDGRFFKRASRPSGGKHS